MKLLLDFVPVILFFATYKIAGQNAALAASLGTQWFGFAVGSGVVAEDQAPVLWATVVAIVATLVQVGWMLASGRKVGPALWMSLAVITIMGGLTIWLNSEIFIKWKPTLLYLMFAAVLLAGQLIWRKNLLRALLGKEIQLPDAVWLRLLQWWIAFFLAVAGLNLFVAYTFSTEVWVNFKVFGLIALTLLFTLAQGFYMARHMPQEPEGKTGDA